MPLSISRPSTITPACVLLAFAWPLASGQAQRTARPTIELKPGLVITTSVRVTPKTYRLVAPASLDSAVITIRGSNVTVDFTGATMEGLDPNADPDLASGVAIRVDSGQNVRIIGARLHGYKIAIMARGTRGLTLTGNDLSNNWKPRLFSLIEHESLADWLSYHHNEKDEWLRFGAAIYLADVSGGELRDNTVEQGMNGLMMTRTDHLRVVENDFSFNSGIGIGLYRSSNNSIVRNRVDFDVRGYSHGFYRRGQDSAGILMYEQSSHNIVAYNSVTHGGDGLFLWAGQTTMDTGEGGANDNTFFANDFSFAPTNGMEATFSRNTFLGNRIEGSDHGLWGGYSFESMVIGNCFVKNRVGIAIEHGQNNTVSENHFEGDSTAISVWANAIEPSDWGYPKHRDTRSRDYRVERNAFGANRVAARVLNTSGFAMEGNDLRGADTAMVLRDTSSFSALGNTITAGAGRSDTAATCTPAPQLVAEHGSLAPALAGVTPAVPSSPLMHRGRAAIIVDEWGPYDWKSPKLWPVDSTHAVPLHLAVLGPSGAWRTVNRRGIAALSRTSGLTGDTITVTPEPSALGDWELTVEYRGAPTVSPRGERRAAAAPYRFTYGHFEPAVDWNVRFFAWSDSTDPRSKAAAFAALVTSAPLLVRRETRLDYEWYRPMIKELPPARIALEATGTVQLTAGEYTLRAISDDAVRVWIDGNLAIDDWTPHESALGYAPLSGGRHQLRVQHYQVDGWTELRVEIVRGRQRSKGSPGPH
jgi:hypothetical protein